MKLSLDEVALATGGKLIMGSPQDRMMGVSTDSRSLKKGDLFFALRGPRHDGHRYLDEAFQKGAVAAVVDSEGPAMPDGRPLIQVSDTLRALGDLAQAYRKKFPVKVVAVTGSNGKTTTKDMIAAILRKQFHVLKTEGNFNNLIGLPLTLFRLDDSVEVAVLEMGMNRPGEIDRLAEVALPHIGVITNIARAHLGELGSLQAIARAKSELLRRLPRDGVAILNGDDPFSRPLKKQASGPVIFFGKKRGAETRLLSSRLDDFRGMSFSVSFRKSSHAGGKSARFRMPALGQSNVSNALAALAVGNLLGVPVGQMKKALASFRTESKRMEILRLPRKIIVINDCYNANPDSMVQSLRLMRELMREKKKASRVGSRSIAILGEMLELGAYAQKCHREVGREAARAGVDLLFVIGEHADDLVKGARRGGLSPKSILGFPSVEEAIPAVRAHLCPGDRVLLKGSRGMKMERVIDAL